LSFRKNVRNPQYIKYNQWALSPDARKVFGQAQQIVPEGESLATLTPLTLHFDYRRNRIINIAPCALVNPWIDFPFTEESGEAIKYFINSGVHYVLMQYRSYAVRTEPELMFGMADPYPAVHVTSAKAHLLTKILYDIIGDSQILYNDGSIVVIKLSDKIP